MPIWSPRELGWLFIDPKNPHARFYSITLTGYDWGNMKMQQFVNSKLFPEVQKMFSPCKDIGPFQLWIVSLPPPLLALCSKLPPLSLANSPYEKTSTANGLRRTRRTSIPQA